MELLDATDARDRPTYIKHLPEEIIGRETTELILDLRFASHLRSPIKKPEEIKKKILLDLIKKKFHTCFMATIRWTPGQSHLLDDLTKDDPNISKLIYKGMICGTHSIRTPQTLFLLTYQDLQSVPTKEVIYPWI